MAFPLLFSSRGEVYKVENLERDWYVVYSKPHKEEQAQFHLGLKGLESFFPRLYLPGSIERKKRISNGISY